MTAHARGALPPLCPAMDARQCGPSPLPTAQRRERSPRERWLHPRTALRDLGETPRRGGGTPPPGNVRWSDTAGGRTRQVARGAQLEGHLQWRGWSRTADSCPCILEWRILSGKRRQERGRELGAGRGGAGWAEPSSGHPLRPFAALPVPRLSQGPWFSKVSERWLPGTEWSFLCHLGRVIWMPEVCSRASQTRFVSMVTKHCSPCPTMHQEGTLAAG